MTDRANLLRVASLVKAAIATQDYVPALKHLRFSPDDGCTAYNDIAALQAWAETDLNCCVPGALFISALQGFKAEKVAVDRDGDAAIILKSGRSRMKLPVLPASDFPFQWPDAGARTPTIELDDDLVAGIGHCLMSVGNNPQHPAQMGVTVDIDEDCNAVLYSTDAFSITRYATATKIDLPGNAPVILPTFFCEQLLSFAKAFPKDAMTLRILSTAVIAEFGEPGSPVARIFHRAPVELQPLDFAVAVEKSGVNVNRIGKELVPIPDGWDSAFQRALLVLDGVKHKVSALTGTDKSVRVVTTSANGEADEDLDWKGDAGTGYRATYLVDPVLVLRASARCERVQCAERVMVFGDAAGKLLHLVAYTVR